MNSAPHPVVSGAAALGVVIAMWPSGLPRPTLTSALLTVACVGLATTVSALVTRKRTVGPRAAATGLVAAGVVTLGSAVASLMWQRALRADLGVAEVGIDWATMSVIPAVAVFAAIVLAPRATAVGTTLAAALVVGQLPTADADAGHRGPNVPPGVVYAYEDGASLDRRAHDLAVRWQQLGGVDRRAVVIAVPTGSGWVDRAAVDGFTERFGADVTILALQYAHEPSWRAFVGDRSLPGRSAIALVREVMEITDVRPESRRPEIHLYGQSLGALGAETARVWAAEHHPGSVADTVLSGVPGDSIGATPEPGSHRSVLANASDPVPHWSWSLLWRPARPPHDTTIVGPTAPRPPWLPVIGFVGTSIDLLSSVDGPRGVGHRYGPEQAQPGGGPHRVDATPVPSGQTR